ncbi:hypothetical protein [Nocardia brasiliensis]|uniref:hypothetical protein n=1 Tax=Nocardia brasiliensis TaxID=37326 RepID=UPI003D8A6E11
MTNALLGEIERSQFLGEPEAHRIGAALLESPLWSLTSEEQYQALAEALDSGLPISGASTTSYSEDTARDLISAVVAALDELRPWPVPALRPLASTRRDEVAGAPIVAHVTILWPQVEAALGQTFHTTPDGACQYLLAELRSGIEIGFLWYGDSQQDGTLVVALNAEVSRQQIVDELIETIGIDSADITVDYTES